MKYSKLNCFWGDYALVGVGNNGTSKWGMINKQGNEIIPTIYDALNYYGAEYVLANMGLHEDIDNNEFSNGLWGVLNLKGEELIPCEFLDIYSLNTHNVYFAATSKELQLVGVIDKNGYQVIPFIYRSILSSPDKDILHIVTQNNKHGLMKIDGSVIIEPEFDDMDLGWDGNPLRDKFIAVSKDGNYFFLNLQAERVLF